MNKIIKWNHLKIENQYVLYFIWILESLNSKFWSKLKTLLYNFNWKKLYDSWTEFPYFFLYNSNDLVRFGADLGLVLTKSLVLLTFTLKDLDSNLSHSHTLLTYLMIGLACCTVHLRTYVRSALSARTKTNSYSRIPLR